MDAGKSKQWVRVILNVLSYFLTLKKILLSYFFIICFLIN